MILLFTYLISVNLKRTSSHYQYLMVTSTFLSSSSNIVLYMRIVSLGNSNFNALVFTKFFFLFTAVRLVITWSRSFENLKRVLLINNVMKETRSLDFLIFYLCYLLEKFLVPSDYNWRNDSNGILHLLQISANHIVHARVIGLRRKH